MEPKKTWNTANTGSTRSSARLCPGFASVEDTLTNSREGWNTNIVSFDRELIAFCIAVDRRSGNGDRTRTESLT